MPHHTDRRSFMKTVSEVHPNIPDVLVADDDPIFRSLLTAKLTSLRCRVFSAEDGREAWDLLTQRRFALVIADLTMPNIDGVTLIQCIRAYPNTKHLPIIVCTSRETTEHLKEAISAGASSYMTKPVNWSMFEAHILHMLQLGCEAEHAMRTVERLEAQIAAKDAIIARLVQDVENSVAATDSTREIFKNAYASYIASPGRGVQSTT